MISWFGWYHDSYRLRVLWNRFGIAVVAVFALGLFSGPLWSQSPAFGRIDALNFTMVAGGPNPMPQLITVNSAGGNFSWGATVVTPTGGEWLRIYQPGYTPGRSVTGYTPSLLYVSVQAGTLAAGSYVGEILFTAGVTTLRVTATLSLGSTGAPVFAGVAERLAFVFRPGAANPPVQTILVSNAGSGTLTWTAAVATFAGGNWLAVSPLSGTAPSTVTIAVTAQALPAGLYTGQLLLQGPGTSITVPVSLVVGENVFAPIASLNFTMVAGGPNPTPQLITVKSAGGNFSWGVTVVTPTGGDWLRIYQPGYTPGRSATGYTPSLLYVSVEAGTLSQGTYAGQLAFISGSSVLTVPVSLTVSGSSTRLETKFPFVWPLISATPGQAYGQHAWTSSLRHHTGLDIRATDDVPVVAAAWGFAKAFPMDPRKDPREADNHCMGNVVIVDHSGDNKTGPFTLYAHLKDDEYLLRENKEVEAGERIGTVGKTPTVGRNGCNPPQQPHLHFEIKDAPVLENPTGGHACQYDTLQGPCWGYTPGHPDHYGYHDPILALHGMSPVPVEVTPRGVGANLRIGPGIEYRCLRPSLTEECLTAATGDRFLVSALSSATSGCDLGWYRIQKTVGKDCTAYSDACFPDGAGHAATAWICRGLSDDLWVEPVLFGRR